VSQSSAFARVTSSGAGKFFKILDRALRWRMVARSGREFPVAHGPQLSAERLLGDCDAEFPRRSDDPLPQIDQPQRSSL
jgi:hypothetical protein